METRGKRERGREVVRCEVLVAGLIEMAGVELQRTKRNVSRGPSSAYAAAQKQPVPDEIE